MLESNVSSYVPKFSSLLVGTSVLALSLLNRSLSALPDPKWVGTSPIRRGNALVSVRIGLPAVHDPILDRYRPRTDLGDKLLALRRAYIERGGHLLTWDEINEEVRMRRGGVEGA